MSQTQHDADQTVEVKICLLKTELDRDKNGQIKFFEAQLTTDVV